VRGLEVLGYYVCFGRQQPRGLDRRAYFMISNARDELESDFVRDSAASVDFTAVAQSDLNQADTCGLLDPHLVEDQQADRCACVVPQSG
jgi:hypothetical protein